MEARLVYLAILSALVLLCSVHYFAVPVPPLFTVSGIDTWVILKHLLRKLMEKDNIFIPASHPHLHYVGRWMPTANQLRRDAAFRGSYVEMVVANTTGLSVSLNNLNSASKQQQHPARLDARDLHHSVLPSVNARASDPVSFVVSIEGHHNTYWVEAAGLVVPIVQNLDPQKTYRVRLTHMGGPNGTNGDLEFEGVWLENARAASPTSSNETSPTARLLAFGDEDGPRRRRRNVVEIATSEASLSFINPLLPATSPTDPDDGGGGVTNWFTELDAVVVDTTGTGLLPTPESRLSVRDSFFRAGPPGTKAGARSWNFKLYHPSVLLLQLGLEDFDAFFSDTGIGTGERSPVTQHALAKFTNEFVDAYVKLVQGIRANAYPFNSNSDSEVASSSSVELLDDEDPDDVSYIYNSAPSTLTIFLLTPFSAAAAHRHHVLVAKKLTLHRVISSAVAQVVAAVQAEGDKSTFWIDTTGWLDAETDFDDDVDDDYEESSNQFQKSPSSSSMLNKAGMSKVTTLLADHLCPYVGVSTAHGSALGLGGGACPFDPYDDYLGDVFLPQDVEFSRSVLKHKIELIKQKFDLWR
ncbi:hypothetical protein AYL99_09175 [Fonsecaea erecta]|uniref:Uncharacterized protein n=1 Tax=Fonsecaea erecta TaxID=1367422 RepID=A0A178ZBL7_9EURO|nr:hypothetical protein AYL99_09175 [Fonsecaea erecta]OAP57062.1 hypothetical protein AYL99_09175 [Fonsecaea erecta]